MANQHPLFNALRVCVSRYNKKSGENWQCSVDGPNLMRVWVSHQEVKPVAPVPSNDATKPAMSAPVEHPTKFEFIAFLETMQPGHQFTLPTPMSHRFEELTDWLIEYEDKQKRGFESTFDEKRNELTIKRAAPNGTLAIA